ncbi:MAG: uracil-DNA glycosylase family protein [Flavobacteriaceae bacterium]|nr:uracil-DNA glycosylase family protein [Flavobacteriaceae bacterium]
MLHHSHPYQPFIPKNATKLIVGTLPPPRFSTNKLYSDDVDFCYGSKYGLLWPILENIFNLELEYQNTQNAIDQRKYFLQQNLIGICDMVESCVRDKIDASDLGMKNIKLRNLTHFLNQHPTIKTILFMGGNSKNGPEYFFRKHLKLNGLKLLLVSKKTPKIHQFQLENRIIKTVSLISPSNAANRSIGANLLYKNLKKKNNTYTTFDFRLNQYQKYFL